MELLLLALVPALAVLWFYYAQDRRREPYGLIVMTFGVGFFACAVAYPLERWAQQFFPPRQHLFFECLLIPGLIEESVKLLVVVLAVFWRAEFDEPVDGLIYATAAALGFTFGEDWRYYVLHGIDASRIFSTAAHPWFSCFWGAALGLARFAPWRRGVLLVGAGLALAVVTHALFDYCVLTAEAYPNWAWLRWFVAPILIFLCLAMDRLFIRMQPRPAPRRPNGLAAAPKSNRMTMEAAMRTVEFHAIVDHDQVIRPPDGVTLPRGEVEVTVRSRHPEAAPSSDSMTPTREWLLALPAEAEQAAPDLPRDMAEHHDHYAHGKARP